MLKRIALMAALVAVFATVFTAAPAPARAADETVLKYGEAVEGEITETADTATYTFEGKKGELVFVQVVPLQEEGSYDTLQASLKLSDAKGKALGDTEESEHTVIGAFADAVSEVLAADGTYTIEIGASKNASDKSKVGKYALQLLKPEKLAAGKSIDMTAKYKGYSRFVGVFMVQEKADFTLNLDAKNSADVGVDLIVHQYSKDYGFLSKARTEGKGIKSVSMVITPDQNFYLVTVSPNGVLFKETQLKYTLTLNPGK